MKSSRRRRFGQHFLNSKYVAKRIVDVAKIDGEVVLEIGPGKGMITRQLAQRARRIFGVEIDKLLANRLRKLDLGNLVVVNDDFLKLRLESFGKPVVLGNVPYSITTHIIQKLISQRQYVKRAILTVQKEYGDRMRAHVGTSKYGAITLFINYYFKVKKAFSISARFFSPRPKVGSVVVVLTKKAPRFQLCNEAHFFEFIKGVFRYRRKSIKNAIKEYMIQKQYTFVEDLSDKRPADLTLDDFYHLYNVIYH